MKLQEKFELYRVEIVRNMNVNYWGSFIRNNVCHFFFFKTILQIECENVEGLLCL